MIRRNSDTFTQNRPRGLLILTRPLETHGQLNRTFAGVGDSHLDPDHAALDAKFPLFKKGGLGRDLPRPKHCQKQKNSLHNQSDVQVAVAFKAYSPAVNSLASLS